MTEFRVGDRVTFTANKRDNAYAYGLDALERFNGTTGTVTALGFSVVYVKWDTPLDTYHRRPKPDDALSTFPENLTLIKEPTVTTFKPGDRVVYQHVSDGSPLHNGQRGTVKEVFDSYNVEPYADVVWDTSSTAPSHPFLHNLVLAPASPYADTIADLRAKAAAKRAEADALDTAADTLEKIK